MASEKAAAMLLDFTNVRDRGDYNPVHVEPGEYLMTITAVVSQESKQNNPMWVFAFSFVSAPIPSAARATYPFYCVLDAKSLWKVRGLALAAGYNVPRAKFQLDPNRLLKRQIGVIIEDDEYEGKVRSKVTQVMPPSELDEQPATGDISDPDDVDNSSEVPPDDDLDGVDL